MPGMFTGPPHCCDMPQFHEGVTRMFDCMPVAASTRVYMNTLGMGAAHPLSVGPGKVAVGTQLVDPIVNADVPMGQVLQPVAPLMTLYVPTAQGVQEVAPGNDENWPAGHMSHTAAPSFPLKVPGGQAWAA